VNKNAERFFTAEFLRARCDISDARIATEEFEKEKKRFSNEHEGLKLRVGNSRINIPLIKLKRGYLELAGWVVDLSFFVLIVYVHSNSVNKLPHFSREWCKISPRVSLGRCKVITHK
jgi:hypothetical protein